MSTTKYEARTFAWVRDRKNKSKEVAVFITRVDGFDVFYCPVRGDGYLGAELSIHSRSGRIRPAAKGEFVMHIEHNANREATGGSSYEISLPKPTGDYEPPGLSYEGLTRSEALRLAKEKWGADSSGRVFIVNRIPRD